MIREIVPYDLLWSAVTCHRLGWRRLFATFMYEKKKRRQVGALQRGVINSTAMRKRTTIATTIVLALLSSACSTSLFKVKPVIELPSFPENSRTADAGGVTVRVAPLLSDEETQDLFEVDLPMTGVLAVRGLFRNERTRVSPSISGSTRS